MKNLLLSISILLSFIYTSFSQDLSQPKGGGTLDIVLLSPGDGHSLMNFEGNITGYGLVFAQMKVSSISYSKTSGSLDGNARTILNDGTLISSPIKGS